MKASILSSLALAFTSQVLAAPQVTKQDGDGEFENGQPISGDGKGGPILGKFAFTATTLLSPSYRSPVSRRHQLRRRQAKPKQPGPAGHRQRHRAQPQMEVLRLQDPSPKGRLGP